MAPSPLVAVHGGEVLAGPFLFADVIEAIARRVNNVGGRLTGEELMTLYGQSLPGSSVT